MRKIKRLNIFVDETGEFGFGYGASELYGVSFTFHEQENNINKQIFELNNRLEKIGYTNMIHMADLIMKRGDYAKLNIEKRRKIFNAIYHFARKIPVKYKTIIINKNYINNSKILKVQLTYEINKIIIDNNDYFQSFDKIVLYYDNGQEQLGNILDSAFIKFNNFEHRKDFNHQQKRLFQISDMLTYIDKFDYKYKNKMTFSKSEKYFFEEKSIRKIIKTLYDKRL